MTSPTFDDIEDQLDNFIIRKPRENVNTYAAARKETKDGQQIHEHLPLLVNDILGSSPDPDDKGVFTVFNPTTLKYRTCLAYGFVAGRGVHNKSFYKYIIDDGTGTMEFSIYVKPRESELIKRLYNEANSLVGTAGLQYERVSASMVRLLGKALEYIDGSVILPGNNVLLYGRPKRFRDKNVFDVISFTVDNGKSRKLEIAFNDNLIDYYQSHGAT
ncbi:uncharacterized protein LOC115770370 [Drosophila novamexicana]|uniref:uncharacterized protein LOC115770370 n=1 Tax=Drosophila novamexicana TaxID=47314 RepID=UPI0011E5C61F|nr:uncharacterized protein LOC115770370 [Drosophila novamexicana]